MPRVLNKHRDPIHMDAIYVGRPSKWGNPFRIGDKIGGHVIDRLEAIALYRDWLTNTETGKEQLAHIGELTGHDLWCWCAPAPCHAEVLLELANKV